MSTIIAGRFAELAHANDAVAALKRAGFPNDLIAQFFVTPAGQHDAQGQDHDLDDSAGAETAGRGAAAGAGAGAGVGAVVGLAATPLLGPAGPIAGAAVGAYVGSLHGTLNQLDEGQQAAPFPDNNTAPPVDEPPPRKSGFLVAVMTDGEEHSAVDALASTGACEIERAHGTIGGGKWNDFDPVAPPEIIAPTRAMGSPSFDPGKARLLSPR